MQAILNDIIIENLNTIPIMIMTYTNVLRIEIQNNIYDIYIDITNHNRYYDIEFNDDILNITSYYTVNNLWELYKLINYLTYNLKPHRLY